MRAVIRNNNDGTWSTIFIDAQEEKMISRFIWGKESKKMALNYAREINNRLKVNPNYRPL